MQLLAFETFGTSSAILFDNYPSYCNSIAMNLKLSEWIFHKRPVIQLVEFQLQLQLNIKLVYKI